MIYKLNMFSIIHHAFNNQLSRHAMKKLFLFLFALCLLRVAPSFAANAFVQAQILGTDGTTATTIAATFSTAVTSGNLVAGACMWGSANTSDLTSVTDNQSNTYTIVRSIADAGDGQSAATFYRANVTNAPTTVTCNLAASLPYRGISIHEVSGADTSAPLGVETGQTQQSPGTGANALTSGSVTTTTNGEYIYGVSFNDGDLGTGSSDFAPGTGFTERSEHLTTTELSLASEDQIQTSAGSIAATFTLARNFSHITFIMTFKAAGAGGSAARRRAPIIF